MAPSCPGRSIAFSRQALTPQIVRRRAALAALEAEMIAACEAAALAHPFGNGRALSIVNAGTGPPGIATSPPPCGWRLIYGPRMRRLRQEIGQLERLMTLPIAA